MSQETFQEKRRQLSKYRRLVTELHQLIPVFRGYNMSKNMDILLAVKAINRLIEREEKQIEFLCSKCGAIVKGGVCAGCEYNYRA